MRPETKKGSRTKNGPDHVARTLANNGCPDDAVSPTLDVDLDETLGVPLQDGTVVVIKLAQLKSEKQVGDKRCNDLMRHIHSIGYHSIAGTGGFLVQRENFFVSILEESSGWSSDEIEDHSLCRIRGVFTASVGPTNSFEPGDKRLLKRKILFICSVTTQQV